MQQRFSAPLTALKAVSPLLSTSTEEERHGKANRESAAKDAAGLVTGNQDSMEDVFADNFSTYQADAAERKSNSLTVISSLCVVSQMQLENKFPEGHELFTSSYMEGFWRKYIRNISLRVLGLCEAQSKRGMLLAQVQPM